eukprot:jgi/Tetstr1/428525/TSEL_001855.t1
MGAGGMGATPHTVMLAVHCKRGEETDLKGPLRAFVQANYSPHDAEECADDLDAVAGWRRAVVVQGGSPESLRDTLVKYYKALCAIETRFPVSKDKEHVNVNFTWYDAFKPTKKTAQVNINFEKAAVLFNIAATLSQIAIAADRSDSQGVKDACKFFQESAGALTFLKDHVAMKTDTPRPVDISPECITMLEKLMLSQAQEIFYEKAVADGKTSAVVAKLGKQTAILYEEVYRTLTSNAMLAAHFDKSWCNHALAKSQYYDVQACYRQGLGHYEKAEIGPAIVYMRKALLIIEDAKKHSRMVHQDMADNLKLLERECMSSLAKYDKENNTVYLERLPAADALPAIVGAQLVRASVPAFLTDKAPSEVFTSVVPDTSAKVLSRYTDMVDSTCRELLDRLDGSSDDARVRLRQWELPDLLVALDTGSAAGLPDALRSDLEELGRHNGSLGHLRDISVQISECRGQAEKALASAEELLRTEAKEDADLRAQFKERWSRPPSEGLTTTLWDRIAGYRANLKQAGDSDAKIQDKMAANAERLQGMSLEGASAAMPRLQAPIMSVDDMEPATVVAAMRGALQQLDAIGSHRAGLEESLKELKAKDDILPKLMAASDDHDALFAKEIAKYQPIRELVDKNCAAQDQCLATLQQNHQRFMSLYGVDDWRAACNKAANDVRGTMNLYKELRDNLSEGMRFYLQLQEVISTLVQHCGDYCLTRRIQRDDLMEDLRRQTDQLSQQEADRLAAMQLHNQPPSPHTQHQQPPPSAMYPQQGGPAPGPPYPGVPQPPNYNPYSATPPPPPGAYHHPPPQQYYGQPQQQPYHNPYAGQQHPPPQQQQQHNFQAPGGSHQTASGSNPMFQK